jgi:hypothetical protein
VARKPGHLDIWVTGNDGRVYCAYYNDAGVPWNGWHQVIGPVPSGVPAGAPVTAVARKEGHLDIWVTGNDGQVYTAYYNDAGIPWNGWHQVIGPVPGGLSAGVPVTALARSPEQLDIWVTGNNDRVYTAFYNDAGVPWNGWHQVIGPVPSGVLAGAPVTAVARKPGHLDIWVTGNDGRVYCAYYNDAGVPWNGWHQVIGPVPGGVLAGAPVTAVARKEGHLDIWVVGSDGRVYTAYYNDAGIPWNGWHALNPSGG